MSIDFPQGEPGDGDGLSKLGVTNLHGLFIGDAAVPNTSEILSFRYMYPSKFAVFEGRPVSIIERRSRLIGSDTQEAPRDPGRLRDWQPTLLERRKGVSKARAKWPERTDIHQ